MGIYNYRYFVFQKYLIKHKDIKAQKYLVIIFYYENKLDGMFFMYVRST